MLGPVGYPYPGKVFACCFALLMLFGAIRLLWIAYNRRFDTGPDNWVPHLALATGFFMFFLFLAWGVWHNRLHFIAPDVQEREAGFSEVIVN